MNIVLRVLSFLRVTDENNNLSLTNLAVILMLTKIMTTPALSMQDIAIAAVPLMNYAYKRKISSEQE